MYGILTDGINVNHAVLCCGFCNHPAAEHPINKDSDPYRYSTDCDRYPEEINSYGYDYYLHDAAGNITVLEDYSGNPAGIIELLDGIDENFGEGDTAHYRIEDSLAQYDNGSEYADAIERWVDRDTNVCTHAAHYWYSNLRTGQVVNPTTYGKRRIPKDMREFHTNDLLDADRNVYVEALDGFMVKSYFNLDLDKTEGYQKRLLNQFINKRTRKFHVGSLAITVTAGLVTATCVNPECNIKQVSGDYAQASLSIRQDAELTEMQSFIYQVIRHGNNHGPSWLTTRPDFYKLHFEDCDLNCGEGITCNHNAPRVNDEPDVSMSDVEFIMEHQKFCSDANCKCDEWLANEAPLLKVVA